MKRFKILYRDWINEWLSDKKNYIKESTYACYSNIIYNHIIPELGDYHLDEISNKVIQEFLLELSKKEKKYGKGELAQKTVKDIIIIIKSSLIKAINEDKIKNIELSFKYPKRYSNKKIYVLTRREQNKITNYALNNLTTKNLGILISLYSGIRIGELCALTWSDIDLKRGIIDINKTIQRIYVMNDNIGNGTKIIITNPKTKSANRQIPINKEFLKIIKNFKNDDNTYILSGNYSYIEPRTYRKYFDRVLNELNINHFNFHSLRHTFATNCISLGVDYKTVSELLGHSNVTITLNLYVHPRLSEKKKCIDLVCKVFQEKMG